MSINPRSDDRIKSEKQMAYWASDLLDSEVKEVFAIVHSIQNRYAKRVATSENLNEMRDEILTRLMGMNILAEIDIAPFYNGEPPTVEIIGKVKTDSIHKYGFDHEQKQYEVRKATRRGESYLGEKENVNTKKVKKAKK